MKVLRYIIPVLLLPLLFVQCKKDTLITDSNAKLSFSADTVMFDTVFTTIGSATRNFKIFNPNDQPINVSQIWLAGGTTSQFRINVDGLPVIETENIEIPANDSLWVFAEVTVDPLGSNLPLVVEDSIMFVTNGNTQSVLLTAWGQDAHFHYNEILPCNETWVADKPHVIYGYAAIDSACVLNIQAGVQVHAHANSLLWNYKGTLNVQGQDGNPVVFQGDRLEAFYDDAPGQWFGILMQFPQNSLIEYAEVRNATVGLWMDTIAQDGSGDNGLSLRHSKFENHSAAGLYLRGATVSGENVQVNNCGQYALGILYGGIYNFRHCTFANYWSATNRQDPLLFINNWFEVGSTEFIRPLTNTRFDNCIFFGNNQEEMVFDLKDEAAQDYLFNHCLFRTEGDISGPRYQTCWKNSANPFVDVSLEDYHLTSNAFPVDKGDPFYNTSNFLDLENMPRSDGQPDLGCYERQ